MAKLSQEAELLRSAYEEYLKNISKNRPSTHYSASSTGQCYIKQQFRKKNTEYDDLDFKSLCVLRMGDLIHNDIQTAARENGLPVMQEIRLVDEDLGVMGHADIVFVKKTGKVMMPLDIKTMGSYPWSKKFGRQKKEEKVKRYEMQLGIYAHMISKQFDATIHSMSILYIRRESPSSWREEFIPLGYIDEAIEYWKTVNDLKDTKLEPGVDHGAPFESWECSYCQFASKCNSPYKKG